ncbi:hypothetical protein OH77DRAFT_219810 [Trametes cingulata]|nr:hypothetical protein OH77DRAFT_219810 [Trametes cingulata]
MNERVTDTVLPTTALAHESPSSTSGTGPGGSGHPDKTHILITEDLLLSQLNLLESISVSSDPRVRAGALSRSSSLTRRRRRCWGKRPLRERNICGGGGVALRAVCGISVCCGPQFRCCRTALGRVRTKIRRYPSEPKVGGLGVTTGGCVDTRAVEGKGAGAGRLPRCWCV